MNEKLCILIQISLKFVPKGQIDSGSVHVFGSGNGMVPNGRQGIT